MKRVLQLSDIAEYVDDTVRSDSIGLEQYVTTDSLLQNKEGRSLAANLPPKVASLVAFKKGDTLVANIRPYLKKIWLADCCGGASQDVLVFRAKVGVPQEYLFATLLQDAFFDYVMKAPKGSKMPRGDESHIMRFPLSQIAISDQRKIGKFLSSIDRLIELSRKRIENLEKLAKEIYDYWFVQFDFPDKRGKPYKSSGGKMVYNPEFKREIPAGWEVAGIEEVCSVVDCLHSKKPDYCYEADDCYLLTLENLKKNGYVDLKKKFYISQVDYREWTRNIEVSENDFVITNAGRAGDICRVRKGVSCAAGRNMTVVRSNGVNPYYLRGYFFSDFMQMQIKGGLEMGSLFANFNEASCITVGLFDTDSGVKRCEHGARSAECLQRAA